MNLTTLSDAELLARLHSLQVESHDILAKLIVVLGEVEERNLHLKAACPSIFEFCLRRLGMSEGAAYRRLAAARLVRRFPCMLSRVVSGEVPLSALVLVRDIGNESNVVTVLDAISGKSKREVQEVVAHYAPKPDVPHAVRKILASATSQTLSLPQTAVESDARTESAETRVVVATAVPPRATVTPLSCPDAESARYKVQLTASAQLREKLERATALMRHRNPSGDMAVVLERALDALLEKLEKERLGATTRASKTVPATKRASKAVPATKRASKTVPATTIARAARREVFARDGAACTFVSESGERCGTRDFLELDHSEPRACGGSGDASNLRVRCRAHNGLHAEESFGKEYIRERIHLRQRSASASDPEVTRVP